MVYQIDPVAEPDTAFDPGELAHLAVGNRGRMLDDRRTPIVVTGVDVASGMFELEVTGFEDRGARWLVPLEDVGNFQFRRGAERVDDRAFAAAVAAFDRPLRIDCDPASRVRTEARIAELAVEATGLLRSQWTGSLTLGTRQGDPRLFEAAEAWMEHLRLSDIERGFSLAFASNPYAGELVKAHAIVAAELGLCPYTGKVVRSPAALDGDWARERRADHLVGRLAFVRACFALAGIDEVVLYRGLAADGPIDPVRRRSFVSATFDRDVAEAHFAGGSTTLAAGLFRQRIPVSRLLMTYLETRALNAQYLEAEAVLLADPDSPLF